MKAFQEILIDHWGNKDKIGQDLEISKSSLKRWKKGKDTPHPLIREAVHKYLSNLELEKDLKSQKQVLELEQGILEILTEVDPIKLIKMGAPNDEYAREAGEIVRLCSGVENVEEMTQIVWAVLLCSFSIRIVSTQESYKPLANRIFQLKQNLWKRKN